MKNFQKSLLIFIAMFLVGIVHAHSADSPVTITAKADKNKIRIGDLVKVEISAKNPSGYEFLFPETPEDTGDFTFVESKPKGLPDRQAGKTARVYSLSVYAAGIHTVPSVKVMYRKNKTEEWLVAASPQVLVEVESLLTEKDTDIRDIKAPVAFKNKFWKILLALLAVGALGALVVWFLRRRKKKLEEEAARVKPPDEIAYAQLVELREKDLPAHGLIKEYYSELSDIIRHYIEGRFSYRAPEMTTEEFMEAIKKSQAMKIEHNSYLREFLVSCDMVKFAKYGPTQLEILDSFKLAERFVDQTRVVETDEGRGLPAGQAGTKDEE